MGWVGLDYPNVDESALLDAGGGFSAQGSTLGTVAALVKAAGAQVASMDPTHRDAAVAAFEEWFKSADGPVQRVNADGAGYEFMADFLEIMALIIIALKIYFLWQLTQLLYEVTAAISAAWLSAGASTATIPALIAAARRYVNLALLAAEDAARQIKANIVHLLETWFVKAVLPQAATALGHLAGGANLGDTAQEFAFGTIEGMGKEAAATFAADFAADFKAREKALADFEAAVAAHTGPTPSSGDTSKVFEDLAQSYIDADLAKAKSLDPSSADYEAAFAKWVDDMKTLEKVKWQDAQPD
jgi:hypothetical protein